MRWINTAAAWRTITIGGLTASRRSLKVRLLKNTPRLRRSGVREISPWGPQSSQRRRGESRNQSGDGKFTTKWFMSLRSPTENESREFPGHDFPSVVIPAHAGIQVCSRPVSLDTRLRGYDGTPALAPLAAIIPHRTFEGAHEGHEGFAQCASRTYHSS